jgi:hypothetical protein
MKNNPNKSNINFMILVSKNDEVTKFQTNELVINVLTGTKANTFLLLLKMKLTLKNNSNKMLQATKIGFWDIDSIIKV